MHGLKLPCPIRAFLPSRSLWISELVRYHWHANSVLLGVRYQGACHCNICVWNGWWLWFLSVWQSAWAPSSEWQGLAVNANGREQLAEKRIIISLHYIYTACLSVSFIPLGLSVNSNQCWQCFIYLFCRRQTPSLVPIHHHVRDCVTLTICQTDMITCKEQQVFGGKSLRWWMNRVEEDMGDGIDAFSIFLILVEVWSNVQQDHHLCHQGSLREQRVPVPNWDLWGVRADRMKLVTSLLSLPHYYFLPSSMLEHQVLLCDGVIDTHHPQNHFLQMEPQSSQPPTQHPVRSHLWPLRHLHREKNPLCLFLSLNWKCISRKKDRGGTQLCGTVWRQAANTMPAGRQRSKRPDIMLMEAFGWFLHNFTPHCSSQLSDTVMGAEWDTYNLNKTGKILSQRY